MNSYIEGPGGHYYISSNGYASYLCHLGIVYFINLD